MLTFTHSSVSKVYICLFTLNVSHLLCRVCIDYRKKIFFQISGSAPPSPPNFKPGTEIYEVPEGIRPELQTMGIEVLCWGVRNMAKYQLAAVNSPSVEIEVGGTVLSSDVITNLKRTPNFKKSLMFHVAKLPKETLYMPPINIGVRDNRPFGRKPLVGTHVISDISGFKVPPLMQPFDPLEAIPGALFLLLATFA